MTLCLTTKKCIKTYLYPIFFSWNDSSQEVNSREQLCFYEAFRLNNQHWKHFTIHWNDMKSRIFSQFLEQFWCNVTQHWKIRQNLEFWSFNSLKWNEPKCIWLIEFGSTKSTNKRYAMQVDVGYASFWHHECDLSS